MKHENMDDQQQVQVEQENFEQLGPKRRRLIQKSPDISVPSFESRLPEWAEKCLAFQNSGKMWLPCWASPVVSLAAPEDEGHEENPAAVCVHRLSVVQFSRDMFPGGICGSAGPAGEGPRSTTCGDENRSGQQGSGEKPGASKIRRHFGRISWRSRRKIPG